MKINILMSTYNGERFLSEQIESIQTQTMTDWHLLIRDDGSTDQTPQIIEHYTKADPRITFINADERINQGVIQSFFTLLKHDAADFYFFSDQDDVWLPDKISSTVAEARKYPQETPLLVYTDLTVVGQDLSVLSESMVRSQSGHANTTLRQELTENTVTGGTVLINHALAELWTQADNLLMHDWYLALMASCLGKLVYLDQPTELYRQHDANVLGARTWSKRIQKWFRPQLLFSSYWALIRGSQEQAKKLLDLPLSDDDRELVTAFTQVLAYPFYKRLAILRRYGLRKNKAFHTLVFTLLITTKFAYKE